MKPNAKKFTASNTEPTKAPSEVATEVTTEEKPRRNYTRRSDEEKLAVLRSVAGSLGTVVTRQALKAYAQENGIRWSSLAFIFNHTPCFTSLPGKKRGVYDLCKIKGLPLTVETVQN